MKRVTAFFLTALLALSCGQRVKPQHTEPVTVRVMEIRPDTVAAGVAYVGQVEPSGSTVVSSPYAGTLTALPVRTGQRVRKGEVLAEVRSETVQSACDMAQASLRQAQDGYDRLMQVYDAGGVSPVKKVEVETRLAQAQAAASAARQTLESGTLKAPYSGVIGDVYASRGVELGAFVPVVQVLDLGGVEIHFPVPEKERPAIREGAAATVEVPALGKTLTGRVAGKGMAASPLSHTYDCWVRADDPDLLPGMVCKVRITREAEDGIVIPARALMTGTDGRYVWVVRDSIVQRRRVTLGGYAGEGVVVTEGLQEGDLLVVEGARKVSTGMKVRTIR